MGEEEKPVEPVVPVEPAEPVAPVEEEEKKEVGQKNPESLKMVDAANKAASRLEKANAEKARLLEKEEALRVQQKLDGKASAGDVPAEETPEEYSARIMRGE